VITAMRTPEEKPVAWAKYLSNASIGIEMGAALVVGLAIGWFLDRTFGTKPWCLVIFTAFGIVAGFRNMIVAARKAAAEEDRL
jgi:ATP synthase protein I